MKNQEHITRKKFNNLKKYYDETWDPSEHTLHVGLFGQGVKTLDESYRCATDYIVGIADASLKITKKSRVLDIGCGAGRTLVDICKKYGCEGVGVDISDEQIVDANRHLQNLNRKRTGSGLPKLRIKYIRASGSELNKSLKNDGQFTHVISQDAILMVQDKKSLFENLYRLLIPGGVVAIADFLSENRQEKLGAAENNLVYKFVNWNTSLSFESYQRALAVSGFKMIKAENKNSHMIKTYSMLAKNLGAHVESNDKTYLDLQARYNNIVAAVKNDQMGWGFFLAQKPERKQVLIAGTKKKSIGRFVGRHLHKLGWEVWLYSRHAKNVGKKFWHERKCDITSEKDIDKLLDQMPGLDLALMLADSGVGHKTLEELEKAGVAGCINSKLVGSVLLNKKMVKKYSGRTKPITTIWCAGKTTSKAKQLILYSLVNSGLAAYVGELNNHYPDVISAYYLPTNLTSPSTLGDQYIRQAGSEAKKLAEHPKKLLARIMAIVNGDVRPGMVSGENKVL